MQVAVFLFGIEEIGVQLEEPLSAMPLHDTVARIHAATRQALIASYCVLLRLIASYRPHTRRHPPGPQHARTQKNTHTHTPRGRGVR